jgi:hypothetical protein
VLRSITSGESALNVDLSPAPGAGRNLLARVVTTLSLRLQGRAQRAGPRLAADLGGAHATAPLMVGGATSARRWLAFLGTAGACQALTAFLWPFGPRRRRGAFCPRHSPHGQPRRYVSGGARCCKERPSLRRPILKPCKIVVHGAPPARRKRSLRDP